MTISSMPNAVATWHGMLEAKNPAGLDELLADDVVFHSPVVHTPQKGKAITKLYLSAAFAVLANDKFQYLRETYSEDSAMLEFETELNGVHLNGVDMMRWNEDGQIVDFKVMVRPLKAVNMIHEMMGKMLKQMG